MASAAEIAPESSVAVGAQTVVVATWSALTSADAPVCWRFMVVRVVELDSIRGIVDHNTSQMLRTIGLLPSCAGLRGSTVSFSGVHCLGGSLQV